MPPLNILYIHSHDTGRYIQPYGYAVPTPNLQSFARQGVLFRQAFCGGPTCSPSRAALLTGQCAHSSGMLGLAHRGFSLSDYDQHLVRVLKRGGYRTALCGVQHEAAKADTIGYDEILPRHGHYAQEVAEAACQWLMNKPSGPFFLSVGFYDTHRDFPPAMPADDANYLRPPAPLPDCDRTRRDMATYIASARRLDLGMGSVLAALDAAGLADNTLVICTTDHGIAFPGLKCNLTDHGIGVMLMMRGPGGLAGGKCIDGMVSHVDIFPTICELVGIDKPDWPQGHSILPLIDGSATSIRDEVYAEVTYHAAYEPQRAVRTQRYKYIRRYGDRRTPVLPNCDDSLSKNVWLDEGWASREVDAEQLYDLAFDPNEACNLAGDPRLADVLADMRRRLDDWMSRTNDPLLSGHVPPPKGAIVNEQDQMSPNEPTTKY